MTSLTYAISPASSGGVSGALHRIVAGAHWLKIACAEQRRAARHHAEFTRLDEHALRDLGLSREEYLSYAAEARGIAPATRVRILDDRCRSSSA